MATLMTEEARQGFDAQAIAGDAWPANPNMFSSSCHIAFAIGAWMRRQGWSRPDRVATSRGYRLRIGHSPNDVFVEWRIDGTVSEVG